MISQDEDKVPAKALPTVLFIDDDERLLESLRLALRREPYEILTVTSTERASRVLAQRKVDVVVCDERMPTMTGTTFLTQMKNAAHPA
ncbi:MAG: response regulator, partial [Deltaproteobacteria bacterium]|nr:response regulator [Deltaproteobacteria bacterium]